MKWPFKTYRLFFLAFIGVFYTISSYAQFNIPPKPPQEEQTAVYDYINLLNSRQQNALKQKLLGYADTTSTQIVIAIISTTQGEDISFLGAQWGHAWGIGQADKDNGIFILLAKDDRKVDINTGYGIEHLISDRDAEKIINRIMIPQFKSGNFYEGLDQATDAMFAYLNGAYTEDRDFSVKEFPVELIIILVFIILFIALSSKKNGRGGNGGGGGSLLDVIILSNMGRTGGWGSGSSSGGGWSSGGGSFGGGSFGGGFGGGGFGGGGASGGW